MSCRVTLIASLAVVAVALYVLMILVDFLLVAVLMADDAAEEGKVVRVRMTIAALIPSALVAPGINREPLCMIELSLIPVHRVMTHLAGCRKASHRMIRIRCAVVVRLMAEEARRGSSIVLVIHVTRSAVHTHVRASQREIGIVVVKRPAFPAAHRVALQTEM